MRNSVLSNFCFQTAPDTKRSQQHQHFSFSKLICGIRWCAINHILLYTRVSLIYPVIPAYSFRLPNPAHNNFRQKYIVWHRINRLHPLSFSRQTPDRIFLSRLFFRRYPAVLPRSADMRFVFFQNRLYYRTIHMDPV